MPVIPATQEAEVGDLPDPRRQRLRGAEIAALPSSLGDKSETPSQKKKKEQDQVLCSKMDAAKGDPKQINREAENQICHVFTYKWQLNIVYTWK